MRMIFLMALIATAGPAAAGSIDSVKDNGARSSIERISCAGCAPLEEPAPIDTVTLKQGEQKLEYRTVNGQKMIFRTEALLGGSPVVMVSKAPPEMPTTAGAAPADDAVATPPITIDRTATTSALTADMAVPHTADAKPPVQPFDPDKLQLRLQ